MYNSYVNEEDKFKNNKNNNKMSLLTIVALIFLVVVIIGIAGIIIYSLISSANNDVQAQQGFGWLMIFLIGFGVVFIPYYLIIFIVSLVLDKKDIKRKVLKNALISCFLLLPLFIIFSIGFVIETKDIQRTFNFDVLSVTFPEDFKFSSSSVNFDKEYIKVGFFAETDGDRHCSIEVGIYEYDYDNDLVSNFQKNCSKFHFVDKNLSLYDVYDSVDDLEVEYINGRNWYYYDEYFPNVYYKMYGLVIDESFYKIEILDGSVNNSICKDRVNEFLKNVKYK